MPISNYLSPLGSWATLRAYSCLAFMSLPFAGAWGQGAPAPQVTGSQSANLNDTNIDVAVNPGETIDYDIQLTNSGGDASNVNVQATLDANTTLVGGSVRVGPIGLDDTYNVNGNVSITVPANSGVLVNDLDPDGAPTPVLTVSASDDSSTQGTVAVNADGSFTYTPPVGFIGNDTFTYTVRDAQGLDGLSQGTVTLVVANPIWFIDNTDVTIDDATAGTLANPFNSITNFSARNDGALNNPGDGHAIYLLRGSGFPSGAFVLRNSQVLLGQGVAISSASLGFSLSAFSEAMPVGGSAPTLTNPSGNAIQLGVINTIRGLNVGNVPFNNFAISGAGFGSLTVSDFNVSGTGGVLSLSSGTLNATSNIGSLISTGCTTGIYLQGVDGAGLSVTTMTDISQFSATGVHVENSSASVSFGQLNLVTTSGTTGPLAYGLRVSNTGLIQSTSGVISVGDAVAVDIDTASLLMMQQSVSVDGADRGIDLANTTGSFRITGTGTTSGSGGTIMNTISHGIQLSNAANVTVENVNIQSTGGSAIYGRNECSNLTFRNGTFTTIGTVPALGLHAINFDEADGNGLASVIGTLLLDGITVSGIADSGLVIHNETGTLTATVEGNSSFTNNNDVLGEFGINVEANGTAVVNLTVNGCSFDQIESSAIRFEHDSSSTNQFVVTNCTSTNGGGINDSGGGGITAIASSTGAFNLTIQGNNLLEVSGPGILIDGAVGSSQALTALIGGAVSNLQNTITGNHTVPFSLEDGIGIQKDSGGDWNVEIVGNNLSVISASASNFYHGIYVRGRDNGGTLAINVESNTVNDTDDEGFRLFADDDVPDGFVPTVELTLEANIFDIPSFASAVELDLDDNVAVCANIFDNVLDASDTISLQVGGITTLAVTQVDSAALSAANNSAIVSSSGTIDYGQPACDSPVLPSL